MMIKQESQRTKGTHPNLLDPRGLRLLHLPEKPIHNSQEGPLLEANSHARRGELVILPRDDHAALVVNPDPKPDRPKSAVSAERLFRDLQHAEAKRIQSARVLNPD
jgi:hypothetical protein